MELLMPGLGLIFWMTVAFGIVLFILKKYAWKPILQVMHAREQQLEKSFSDAKRINHEMSQLETMKNTKIAEADKAYEEIIAKAHADAGTIISESRVKAQEEAREISEKAEEMIEQYKAEAFRQIKSQISMLSMDIAEKVLTEELSDRKRNSHYVSKLLDEIEVN